MIGISSGKKSPTFRIRKRYGRLLDFAKKRIKEELTDKELQEIQVIFRELAQLIKEKKATITFKITKAIRGGSYCQVKFGGKSSGMSAFEERAFLSCLFMKEVFELNNQEDAGNMGDSVFLQSDGGLFSRYFFVTKGRGGKTFIQKITSGGTPQEVFSENNIGELIHALLILERVYVTHSRKSGIKIKFDVPDDELLGIIRHFAEQYYH